MPNKFQKIPIKIKEKDYSMEAIECRRDWINSQLGINIDQLSINNTASIYKKNIENLFGAIEIPLGIGGPVHVKGEFAKGLFYVPFATTQGTLVESYHRGMSAITLSGGANCYLQNDHVDTDPVFVFKNVTEIPKFLEWIRVNFTKLKFEAESTTKHGKLLKIHSYVIGRRVYLNMVFQTGEASGLNMINIASHKVCEYIKNTFQVIEKYFLRSNLASDKKPSYFNFINSYGKRVTCDIVLKKEIIKKYLLSSAEEMYKFWYSSLFGSIQSGMIGTNAHYANGLSAIFIATGQDIAQVVNASQGITTLELTPEGDLYFSVNLPCLIVGTIGGGTGLPHQAKCLEIMGCLGENKVKKFVEIIAATLLGGEISIAAALASGIFAQADLKLRKR